jgi:DNA-binding NarL/FixJ family response regulator
VAGSDVTVLLGVGMPAELEMLQHALCRRPGLTVVGCEPVMSGAVEKVAVENPDVAVLCADFPDADGLAACTEIKRNGAGTRVLVIGPSTDDGVLVSAVKAGADGFVSINDTLDDLTQAVHEVSRGASHIPPMMLGGLLRGLIEFRREDDAAFERFASLGKREREVLAGICAGLGDQAIADRLHLSPHTARTHAQNILGKLGVHSRVEATRMVFEHDLFARFGIDFEGLTQQRGGEA